MTLVERLRAALSAIPERPPELLVGDVDDPGAGGDAPMHAAVLVAVTDRADPGVILTERSPALRRHAGQIAFPGGRIDPTDADAAAAAVREADEELGIDPARVVIVGIADRYRTITGFDVTPVIAVIPPDLPMRPNPDEVADWFEMPLRTLLDPAAHVAARLDWQGSERRFYEIRWDGRRIWGATAAIAVNLSRRLAWVG